MSFALAIAFLVVGVLAGVAIIFAALKGPDDK